MSMCIPSQDASLWLTLHTADANGGPPVLAAETHREREIADVTQQGPRAESQNHMKFCSAHRNILEFGRT